MLLELKNIKKYYPVKQGFLGQSSSIVKAVDDVDLSMVPGENLSLVGESGCGKTTLARIVLKLIPMTDGSIFFNSVDVGSLSNSKFKHFRKDIQMVFQDPYNSLDPRFTIRKVIKEATYLDRSKYKLPGDIESKLHSIMKDVGLKEEMLNRFPHEFSGGERQRIAIARALMMNPKLVILDEAVSSLDVIIQEQIIGLLAELQSKYNLTYLFISHNLRVVRKISQKIAVMYKGKIVELAKTEEIFNNPLHPYTKELLSAALNYKAIEREKDLEISPHAILVDHGGGHLVLE